MFRTFSKERLPYLVSFSPLRSIIGVAAQLISKVRNYHNLKVRAVFAMERDTRGIDIYVRILTHRTEPSDKRLGYMGNIRERKILF